MRASMNLGRLNDATQYRLERLHRLHRSLGALSVDQQSMRLAYISIELDNLNICALREFTISTMRGAKTTKGNKITVNNVLGAEDEIGAYILSIANSVKYKNMKFPARVKRTDEPTIRDPKETEKILVASGASNVVSIQNALALNTNLFRDLKHIRHFYAHRCKDTFGKASANAASYGVRNPNHPDDILRYVVTGKPHSVLEQWIVEAKFFYDLLME
ncbi:hypothetical protein [Pseudomonas moorei]|uniref:Uncharacterized protein n=1 Tax=Pseudomonas moorei TaxID=395599 RepID=A0A1H1EVW6_9PSED|nr:hypothetical protein [Pseudomonas moorei]KAB0507609.1 hypothetical protein F7R06_05455 [Pseudomonas moorei]SDQ92885.1 hypothetical protein SAMN04490195_2382 [Pseudomonas moorei]